MDLYIRHPEIVRQFIYSFKETNKNLLEQSNQHRFSLSSTCTTDTHTLHEAANNFLTKYTPKRYYITEDDHGYLTPKEMQIISLCIQNMTAKEIARELSISPRTVEEYIEIVRRKFNLISKSALIDFFKKTL
jgi:DNA-binding CsgD family transcriptional regulator